MYSLKDILLEDSTMKYMQENYPELVDILEVMIEDDTFPEVSTPDNSLKEIAGFLKATKELLATEKRILN